MKVVLVISSIVKTNPGIGGHYYSLLETVKQLEKEHDVYIVNIGSKKAIALMQSEYDIKYITKSSIGIYKTHKYFKKYVKELRPEVLWGFDSVAYFWCRTVGNTLKIPHGYTKCGGVNPRYSPFSNNIVLFSRENLEFFRGLKKFSKSNLYLIPNRIVKFDTDFKRIEKIKKKLNLTSDSFKFLRISRIKPFYQKSAIQIINLVNRLNEDGINCVLIFIGEVESETTFNKLKLHSGNQIFFLTDEEYTSNAKEIIEVADVVLGTGRSFMEAATKKRILLSPLAEGRYPLLIDRQNYDSAFKYNFSERVKIDMYDEEMNYKNVKNLIQNKEIQRKKRQFSSEVFNRDFDANGIGRKYMEVFDSMDNKAKEDIADLAFHFLFVLRKYLQK